MAVAPGRNRRPRPPRETRLIDRILDFPYRRLFGLTGSVVMASVVVVALGTRFAIGIATVTLQPSTCTLAWADNVYRPFHEHRILANTQRELPRLLAEKQTALWAVNAGRDPFPAKGTGNVASAQRIDKDKFFWRAYAANLEKDIVAISDCLRRLPTYRFG